LARRMFAFHRDEFDRERVVSSPFVSTRTLFFVRFILTLYMLIVNLQLLIYQASRGNARFLYAFFTNLSYIGLTSYMVTATVHTGIAAFNTTNRYYLFDLLPSFFSNVLLWLVYETAIPYSFVVTVIYWSILYRASDQPSAIKTYSNVSVHALNFVFAFIEMSLNRMVMKRSHTIYFCIPAVLYLCLAWMLYGIYGVFVYPFLDFVRYKAAIVGIIAGLVVGFILVFMV
ncbi:hypothetical protein GQ42DRAFT_107416, partial [Ramicandelaber brevisporus]